MINIVDLILEKLQSRLQEKQLNLELTNKAKQTIVSLSYDPQFGARPIRRFTQSKIETLIARTILSSDLSPDDTLVVDCNDNDEFFVTIKSK